MSAYGHAVATTGSPQQIMSSSEAGAQADTLRQVAEAFVTTIRAARSGIRRRASALCKIEAHFRRGCVCAFFAAFLRGPIPKSSTAPAGIKELEKPISRIIHRTSCKLQT